MLASVSGLTLAFAEVASAQPASGPAADAAAQVGEIIVTARRREERLQDVPQTVTAVTGAQVEKLNLLRMSELGKAVAGLQIVGTDISMRGVTFDRASSARPTTATYLNDAPVLSTTIFQAMFDVGQIEVLRGPQGTTRGISSPSGALTLTTRRPGLSGFGGTAIGSITNRDGYNLQGGVDVPIVRDKLALRLAGLYDRNEGNGVRSVNSSLEPRSRTEALRSSLRFEPTPEVKVNLVYQYMGVSDRDFGSAGAVFGSGAPGGVNPNAPAGFNGPVLARSDRRAVVGYVAHTVSRNDVVTGQIDWNVAGQTISYVGSWQRFKSRPDSSVGDPANVLLGYPLNGPIFPLLNSIRTDEVRIASAERLAGFLDYVIGAFRQEEKQTPNGDNGVAAFLPGAFGAPGTLPRPGAPNTRYQLNTLISTPGKYEETSFFAKATAHWGEKLEISGGVRRIESKTSRQLTISTTSAFTAQAGVPAAFCTGLGGQFGATYPGVCDIPVPGAVQLRSDESKKKNTWIYDLSLAYHFTRDLMVYGHTGSSFRPGPTNIGVSNPTDNPLLRSFTFLQPEKSKSYEVGLKWLFADGRGRLNVDYFHQTFDGLIYRVPGNTFYYTPLPRPAVLTNPFFTNQPAKVNGFDVDFGLDVTPELAVSANVSYAKGKISGAVPCNDGNFDGVPDGITPTPAAFQAAGVFIATCETSAGASSAPNWNARGQFDYRRPVSGELEGFVRGLLAYQPKNSNVSQTFTSPAYATLDVFLGLRSQAGWEASIYGKNITNTRKVLNESAGFINPPGGLLAVFGPTGYRTVTWSPHREFGLMVRYAFGPG
jgi:iron complex outermembrane receptor protein